MNYQDGVLTGHYLEFTKYWGLNIIKLLHQNDCQITSFFKNLLMLIHNLFFSSPFHLLGWR